MWNLVEPQLLRMEPVCGTSWNLAEPGLRFRAAAPKHPEALLEEPQAFQAAGEKLEEWWPDRKKRKGHRCKDRRSRRNMSTS